MRKNQVNALTVRHGQVDESKIKSLNSFNYSRNNTPDIQTIHLRDPSRLTGTHQLSVQSRIVPPQREAQNSPHSQKSSINAMT